MTKQLAEELSQFHSQANWKEATVGNNIWEYAIGGEEGDWLLLIHGGGGDSETMFRYFNALLPRFRIIAPSIPGSIDNMQEITDGLVQLFNKEGIEQVHQFGSSLGGMVAQVLACYHPDRIGKSIFSHASLPQPEQGTAMSKARLPLKLMPYRFFRWQMIRSIKKSLETDIPDITSEEHRFWLSRFENVFKNKLSKVDVLASVELQIDYHQAIDLSQSAARSAPERVMMVFHENDTGFGEAVQNEMKAFYAGANFHLLPLYGHLGAVVRADDIIRLIERFLAPPSPPTPLPQGEGS